MTDTPPLFDAAPLLLPQPARAVVEVSPLIPPDEPLIAILPIVVIAAFSIGTHPHAWRDFARDLKWMPHCLDYRMASPAEVEKLLRRRKPR
jgi:hypothetical protein